MTIADDNNWLKESLRYMCILQNRTAESLSYGWKDDFSMKELRSNHSNFYGNETVRRHFSVSNLTEERCKAIGFAWWSEESDVLLFPLWYVPFIQEGTIVTDINGLTYPYSSEDADLDNRCGNVAFGISAARLPKKITVDCAV